MVTQEEEEAALVVVEKDEAAGKVPVVAVAEGWAGLEGYSADAKEAVMVRVLSRAL